MRKYYLLLLLSFFCYDSRSQILLGKYHEVVTQGVGVNKELAINDALSKAIESIYNAIIKSKTEILDEEILADNIDLSSAGNVKRYKLLSDTIINNEHHVTVESTIFFYKVEWQ